ncbi:MAG: glycine cleavage system protein [Burkholderiaceae bacterium]|jgi:glycine cleavage system H protein|nr:glycine cleavage system protein [Burkholderiaceae bacterium]
MSMPAGLKYTESHEWIRREADGTLTVGITAFAQEALGDMVFVELPEVGRALAKGEACAVVESVKAASDVYAPVAGTVTAVNSALTEKPELVNTDAFAAWMFRLKPVNAADVDTLLDAAAYQANVDAQK